MARIRSVHPGLFTDEAFVGCSPLARLLFVGLWTECDDAGAFEWKPITIKMRLLPVDNADIPALLAELEAANMVKRYAASGREYGAVRNFCRYQRPKKPKSVHPMPVEFRTYVASDDPSSELDDVEAGSSSPPIRPQAKPGPPKPEPPPPQPPPVPKKSRISPQMEDGGGSRKDNPESQQPYDPRAVAAAADLARAKRLEPHDDGSDDELKRVRDACFQALGGQSCPGAANLAIAGFAPIMLLIEQGFRLSQIVAVLRAEIAKPRAKPIRTWDLWARIIAEQLADQPKGSPGAAAEPSVRIFGMEVPERNVRFALERWRAGQGWHDPFGPPPDDPRCVIPERLRQSEVAA